MKTRQLIANYRAPQGLVARMRLVGKPMSSFGGGEAVVDVRVEGQICPGGSGA